jgi:hypothetical protein
MQQSQQGAQMNAESALDSLKTKLAAQQSTLQQAEADGKSEKITTALQASIRRLEQQIAESETKPPSKDVEE